MNARTEDGTTPLMLAARLAVEDLVEELIAARADVGARDKRGNGWLEPGVLSKCGQGGNEVRFTQLAQAGTD